MGFFKDVRQLSAMGKEMQRTSDPGADLRRGTAQLQELNAAFAQQAAAVTATAPGAGVPAQVQVVSVGPAVGSMNVDPILTLEVLVLADGPPRPASATLVVPMIAVHRVQVGAVLPARVDPADPAVFTLDWSAT